MWRRWQATERRPEQDAPEPFDGHRRTQRSCSTDKHIAGGVLEPGDERAAAAHDPALVLLEAVVALDLTPRAVSSSTAASMSSTGKLRIVYSAGVWPGLG